MCYGSFEIDRSRSMSTRGRTSFAAFALILALAIGVSNASALRSLELRPGGAITATARALSFAEPGGLVIVFNVTLAGNLNTRIPKRAGAEIGAIRTCAFSEGTGGFGTVRARCDLNKPWPLTYNSISGSLPTIASVSLTLERMSFLFATESGGVRFDECLYGGSAEPTRERNPMVFTTTRSPIREIIIEPTRTGTQRLQANLEETVQSCLREFRFAGTFNLAASQTIALV
jgi:hypothetical protein